VADFRSERSASPEGEGKAKDFYDEAWTSTYRVSKKINEPLHAAFPFLKNLQRGYATSQMFDLFGFWLMWHLSGGFAGMQKALGMSRSNMYRRIALFRAVFGEHPDVYEFPGITVDPVACVVGMAEKQKKNVPPES
jgi:hypothetical protein